MRSKPKTRAASIDEYLAALPDDQRVALERLRRIIQAAVPRAEECISYQLPAFRLDGKVLLWFGATANHCAFYPGGVVQAFARELADYGTSKGTIRFQPDRPLPATLVRKLIRTRVAGRSARQPRPAQRSRRKRGSSMTPSRG